ncbi:TadE/TadG family type IV pilus assembly protein [Altererythrobacter sp.]|uniref:TadE/TadG family type IV pilus assembly protein n=1 Tax=Altererythrobacter sp. TaxID=1872480 RepID=UPI003D0606A2
MNRIPSTLRRLARDESGVTVVEFALLLIPMLVIVFGGLDLGYQNYVRSVMQGALNDAARRAAVQDPQFSSPGATVEAQVEALIKEKAGTIARNATITVTQESFFEFSDIGNPEALMTDVNGNGQFDEADGDCWEDTNRNGEFDTDSGSAGIGGSNDVVLYKANVQMPRLFPVDKISNLSPTVDMTLETAIRNQPYGSQPTPPVLCGAPA